MVRHATMNKGDSPQETLQGVSNGGRARKATPAKTVRIPELYMRPAGDRDFQGCLKSRA